MKLPTIDRPIFKGLSTDEEKLAAMMTEVAELQKVDPTDGMEFAHKTAQWIAYERYVESERQEDDDDDDRLFNDFLARHLFMPYGKRMSDAFSFGLRGAVFFDSGLQDEGHVMYTAARTKFINDQVAQWLRQRQEQQKEAEKGYQILNLGAGLDTRAFWFEALKVEKEGDNDGCNDALVYWEVDAAPVLKYKQSILDDLKSKGNLPDPLCSRKVVALDFAKESILSLPEKHGFPTDLPTCWILEGLIMYLSQRDVEILLDNLTEMSAVGSLLLLNFAAPSPRVPAKPGGCPSIDDIEERLLSKYSDGSSLSPSQSWTKVGDRRLFGDQDFNFGRYPDDRPSNPYCGFAVYQMGL